MDAGTVEIQQIIQKSAVLTTSLGERSMIMETRLSQTPTQASNPIFQVLDHGEIQLDAYCADDLSVVNAARVSLHNHHATMEEGDDKLINFLMKNHHGTPFEHNFFRFRIKAPLFVFREWHRHRIGHSYNEWSARYSELKGEFYIPSISNVRTQTGKPGHYTYEPAHPNLARTFQDDLTQRSFDGFEAYQEAIQLGIAKEQARFFLPVNIYSEMYWSCNARSLMHFLALRNAPSAMWEIRQYAEHIEQVFLQTMPITQSAFLSCGRVAP